MDSSLMMQKNDAYFSLRRGREMGICWGSPDFPTPSSRPAFDHGKDLTLSSTTSGAASSAAVSNNASSAAVSNNAFSAAVSDNSRSPVAARELKVFEYGELKALTKNFAHAHFDCTDRVYRGWLDEKKSEIAVHLLELPSRPTRMQSSIMVAKIQLFGSVSHPNLAPLLGHCLNHREMLLVYESSENSTSLEDHLFKCPSGPQAEGKDAPPPLSWDRRLQIAVEAAQALDFLHLMDIVFLTYFQASSVLLDKSYGVKILAFNFLITNSKATRRRAMNIVEFNERMEAGFPANI
ncbi:probable serine/threonine-protein kinase PIX13 [Punica granatum]|uniref:Uncharacterized protein n=2 Tax=Punica granatum TaxID=22663 RepID=A0A2I0IAN8_PUNGR|nr:probable serine/threonine-protein kinase PIX13 [Punica granatum]PKI41065.1 hypothetical protein CRG98_038593 [Punica granatum]